MTETGKKLLDALRYMTAPSDGRQAPHEDIVAFLGMPFSGLCRRCVHREVAA